MYAKSNEVSKVIVAPWNDFMTGSKKIQVYKNVVLNRAHSILSLAQFCFPDLIDIAQDNALASWSVDLLKKAKFNVFWPTKAASRIEWDKKWARDFMKRYNLPSPEFEYFSKEKIQDAKKYSRTLLETNKSVFLKANGLHAWKGVVPVDKKNFEQAFGDFENILDEGEWFLVEQWLVWEEFSYYAMIDGDNCIFFPSAQDNKRVFDGDKWPNTWGMWAHCPASITQGREEEIQDIVLKLVEWMRTEWHPYTWILYLWGIVCTDDDKTINLIEFNARWWDPEAQVVLPTLQDDYFDLVTNYYLPKKLNKFKAHFSGDKRLCVVGTTHPYPSDIWAEKWKIITWLQELQKISDLEIYGAGIDKNTGNYVVWWWRLFSVVWSWEDFWSVRTKVYNAIQKIKISDWRLYYRSDIGKSEDK